MVRCELSCHVMSCDVLSCDEMSFDALVMRWHIV